MTVLRRNVFVPLFCACGASLVAASVVLLLSPTASSAFLDLAATVKKSSVRQEWSPRLATILLELLSLGLILLAAAAALVLHRQLTALLAKRHWRIAAAVAVMSFVQGMSAWYRKSTLIDGRRIWFLDDDAMISMRYASNLADGHGLVWNVGERVEGYSNLLWTCMMAGVHWMGIGSETASAAVLVVNVALSCALLIVLDRLATTLGLSVWLASGTLILAALSRELLVWSLSGLETTALAVLCSFALWRIVRDARDHAGTYLALALLPLVRADGVVLSVLIAGASFAIHRDVWRTVRLATAAACPFAVHLGARHYYYGEWLPNTAYLKVGGWEGWLYRGALYDWRFFSLHGAAAVLIVVAVIKRRDRRSIAGLAGLVAAYSGYVLYLGGDAFPGGRFFVPLIPVMFAVAMAGAAAIHSSATRRWAVAALMLTTPLLWHNRYWEPLPAFWSALSPSPGDVGNVRIGRWLADRTDPDSVVADYWAGSVFYFSRRRGVDLLGKMDPVIARMAAVCRDGLPGHNKFDFAHSLGVMQPDFVVAGFRRLQDGTIRGPSGERPTEHDPSPCGMFGALYRYPYFRSVYLPHVASNDGWRTIFRRSRKDEQRHAPVDRTVARAKQRLGR